MPTQIKARLPDKLNAQLELKAAERGFTVSAAVREAFRHWLDDEARADQLDQLEARLVASLNRVDRDSRLARNGTQMVIAMLDTFVRVYLLHTPPIPPEVVKASAASADDRHEKFVRGLIQALQGEGGCSIGWPASSSNPSEGDE